MSNSLNREGSFFLLTTHYIQLMRVYAHSRRGLARALSFVVFVIKKDLCSSSTDLAISVIIPS